MTPQEFQALLHPVAGRIRGKTLDQALEAELNREFPGDGEAVRAMGRACREAIAAGWMCNREAAGIKYGRVVGPLPELAGCSLDVVEMESVKGPHHRHPNGEIDLIMPVSAAAKFDGRGAGWLVYGPGTAHHPTVTDGRAIVLYLLPGGAIEFTRT
ncbi:MAG: DUF4863 family protein [Burkholderiales bacterium]|nr:DUF4863 family protein [Burkholderiales bacterium]